MWGDRSTVDFWSVVQFIMRMLSNSMSIYGFIDIADGVPTLETPVSSTAAYDVAC